MNFEWKLLPLPLVLLASACPSSDSNDGNSNGNEDPEVEFELRTQSITEAGGTATLTVTVTPASSTSVSVPFTISGAAIDPDDYSASASPLVIAAGDESGDITLTVVSDTSLEASEAVAVVLGAPTGADLGSETTHTLTILDDDFPSMTSDDFPLVSPCPNQEHLAPGDEFDAFLTAMSEGSFLYMDVPFNGADPDIYQRKCGFEGLWNPANNTDEIPPRSNDFVLSDFFVTGNAGICSEDFSNFGTDLGFPVAGTYRKELKVSHLGVTYQVRIRVVVSGDAEGVTFASQAIAVPSDLEDTLGYEIDGTDTDHDDVLTGIIDALPSNSIQLDILDTPGGNVLCTAQIVFLCVEEI